MLLGICFTTLSPIGIRPDVGEPHVERFIGFAVLALLFGMAYPRRVPLILAIIIGTAIILEISQSFTGDRHAKSIDVFFKILGAVFGAGVFIGARALLYLCLARYEAAQRPSD